MVITGYFRQFLNSCLILVFDVVKDPEIITIGEVFLLTYLPWKKLLDNMLQFISFRIYSQTEVQFITPKI